VRRSYPIVTGLLLAGLLGGCAAQPDRAPDGAGAVAMDHNVFATEVREVQVGGRITFSNASSRALHVLVVGKDAQPRSQAGAPTFGGASGHRAEVGDRWTTPPWTTPGTYWVTCTLHPSMNLKVVVGER
jgi:plastocyanin